MPSGELCVTDICDVTAGCVSDLTPDCCGNGLVDSPLQCPNVGADNVGDCPSGCVLGDCNGADGDIIALFLSSTHSLTWDMTQSDCEARGGHLAWIESPEENQVVHDLCLQGSIRFRGAVKSGCFSVHHLVIRAVPDLHQLGPDKDGTGPYTPIYLTKNGWGGQWDDVQTTETSDYICRFSSSGSPDLTGSFAQLSLRSNVVKVFKTQHWKNATTAMTSMETAATVLVWLVQCPQDCVAANTLTETTVEKITALMEELETILKLVEPFWGYPGGRREICSIR